MEFLVELFDGILSGAFAAGEYIGAENNDILYLAVTLVLPACCLSWTIVR